MSRKRLVFLVIIAVVLFLIVASAYLIFGRKTPNSQDTGNLSAEQKLIKNNQDYLNSQQDEISKVAKRITTLNDLKKLDTTEQGKVGIEIVDSAIAKKDYSTANLYIDYLTLGEDNYGLDASLKCYQIASTDSRKKQCVDLMNSIARKLNIIGQNEVLPSSYYSNNGGGVGG